MKKNLSSSGGWRRGFAAVLAFACMAAHGLAAEPQSEAVQTIRPVPADPTGFVPPDDPRELLKIDAEMRQFFAARIPRRGSQYTRLRALVDAIIQPEGLNFAYDMEGSFDARETFRRRHGNCVSYAFLVVAVAREFGFDAQFQNIERAARWARVGDIIVSVQHLDVRITTSAGTYVLDLEPDIVPAGNPGAMQLITDERAWSQLYCNLGFEHLVRGRTEEALRDTIRATSLDPSYAGAWSNRATIHARLGDLAAARESFERSLRADPDGATALDGFVALLRRLGTPADLRQAFKLERRARMVREQNPYYHQQLASHAKQQGDLLKAEKLLRRAISLKDDEPEFYVEWVSVLERLGRTDRARHASAKLDRLRTHLAETSVHLTQ